jgi:hypothetical protein
MSVSRLERKRENSRIFFRRLYRALIILITVLTLMITYHKSILCFTVLSVLIFFGIISLNCFNIRLVIPGIASKHLVIRLGAAMFYLVTVIILISKVGFYSGK